MTVAPSGKLKFSCIDLKPTPTKFGKAWNNKDAKNIDYSDFGSIYHHILAKRRLMLDVGLPKFLH